MKVIQCVMCMSGLMLNAGASLGASAELMDEIPQDLVGSRPPVSTLRLEEIVVTGSRLRVSNPEGPSPIVMFSREDIDQLGVASVAEVMKYLPQQPHYRSDFYRNDGAHFAELRGLGADTTLVLVNGRRTVPSASSLVGNAFDMNTIPLAAVERIEVLSDSASAVYGADAVGGVVNIILKRDIPDPVIALHYGAAQGGADERRVSFSGGVSGERWRTSAIFDYFDRNFLLGEKRDRWRNQDYRRFGSVDQRSQLSNPGNIASRTTDNLPGLPSRFAAVPEGSDGVGLSPEDLLQTAGERNLDSITRYDAIVPRSERVSAALFGEFEFKPNLVAFAEAFYSFRDHEAQSLPPTVAGLLTPATNAFNPFGVPVTSNFVIEGIAPRRNRTENELLRGVGGMRGLLGQWDWEVSVTGSQEKASSWTQNAVDPVRVAQALASSDPAQALNVFQDGPGGSEALLSSLIAAPRPNAYESDGIQATGFARGALASVPAGVVEAVVGAEWRAEDMYYSAFLFVEEDRSAKAAFAEVSVPLVSAAMNWPAMHSLSLKLAGRYDDYSDFGQSGNPQYGLVWMPVRDLMLRASYGTSFRPPSLFELYSPPTTVPLPVPDPGRNNELADAVAITGGNTELGPIEGESLTTGFVWTPSIVEGLRVSASYWQIELDHRVSSLPFEVILGYEARFADRVVRAQPTPADIAAGLPGRLVSVDITRVNYGSIRTSGVDGSASYAFDTAIGKWNAALSATWIEKYDSHDLPDAPPIDRVGTANVFGTIPQWRGIATLSWQHRAWAVTLSGRFTGAYDDARGVNPVPNGRRIPMQKHMDAQLVWDSDGLIEGGSSWREGLKVTVGLTNALDESPPFAEISTSRGYDISQGDLRQRFAYLNVSKRF